MNSTDRPDRQQFLWTPIDRISKLNERTKNILTGSFTNSVESERQSDFQVR
jgi:hypothetical protein